MTIYFLRMPLERIDQLCREEEEVEVWVNAYQTIHYPDGTIEKKQTGGWGATVKSSKDIFQFELEDMKILSEDIKRSLR
jgi:hypothetical protein